MSDLFFFCLTALLIGFLTVLVSWAGRAALLRQENRELRAKVLEEMRSCNFWIQVAQELEESGGTSNLLEQRREGARIVDACIGAKWLK